MSNGKDYSFKIRQLEIDHAKAFESYKVQAELDTQNIISKQEV
jgi:hypothetical protein